MICVEHLASNTLDIAYAINHAALLDSELHLQKMSSRVKCKIIPDNR